MSERHECAERIDRLENALARVTHLDDAVVAQSGNKDLLRVDAKAAEQRLRIQALRARNRRMEKP